MAIAEYPTVIAAGGGSPTVDASARTIVRAYFLLLFVLSIAAFIFGVENRLTSGGLFNVRPTVDWLPPLSAQDWFAAFIAHQQDPAFSACGATESLTEFKTLYWWEWGRHVSTLALACAAASALYGASLLRAFRFALPRIASLGLAVLAYGIVRTLVDFEVAHVEVLSSYNVGQYRHVVDVTFASVLVALVFAFAVAPSISRKGFDVRSEWLWLSAIVLDIAFGALFAARDAAGAWTTWPSYGGYILPPIDQLTAYVPSWLNFTFNQTMIQLVHRTLSGALWFVALWQLASARGLSVNLAVVRFSLITAQMLTGIATLLLGVPAVLSVTHQLGSIALLACSFVVLISSKGGALLKPTRAA
jgi:cytochrome c oxidase assembly protein subunit 15